MSFKVIVIRDRDGHFSVMPRSTENMQQLWTALLRVKWIAEEVALPKDRLAVIPHASADEIEEIVLGLPDGIVGRDGLCDILPLEDWSFSSNPFN
jgi:hypothetical protein